MNKILTPRFWLAFSFVIAGVVMRIAPHPWNFAPVGAIALFGGAHFERRALGIVMPLLTMFAGDSLLQLLGGNGYHSLMPVVYATYALIAVIGILIRDRRGSVAAVGAAALMSATLFFLTTNFAVWAMETGYPKTAAGLIACYVAAIPFFGNTLASDLLFTAIFFGLYALSERKVPLFAKAGE